jgi:hypothetical protein
VHLGIPGFFPRVTAGGVPARDAALDVAQTAAFQTLYGKRLVLDVVERIPQQVIRFESHQQRTK